MPTCHHCGQDLPERTQWRGLMVNNVFEAYWRGIKLPTTVGQASVLKPMLRTGYVSHLALEMLAGTAFGDSIKIHVSRLRGVFRDAGVPFTITNIRGSGYRLEPTP